MLEPSAFPSGEPPPPAPPRRRRLRRAGFVVLLLLVGLPLLALLGAAVSLRSAAVRRAVIARVAGSLRVDTSSIRETLSWQPPHTVDRGLDATVAAWRAGRPG